ncbi:50S ribosomal protein L25/general stress protein Ctc [Desulfosarcina sp. OttesenSCG-928-B08]|nr:50S ribosomal protein L25/general stress protein Ctc [Desulfosarcina sp. OttesenSCG-928-B08]
METLSLKASPRDAVGNGPSRVLRRNGKIPAILYGAKIEPVKLAIEKTELEPVFKTGSVSQKLLNLEITNGSGNRRVMIKDVQRHPVSRRLLHLDLYEVAMDKKLRLMVPVVTTGKPIGVEMGGMLQIIRRELEVVCLPDRIPQAITIDVTAMDVGHSFHVKDLKLEDGIDVPAEVNFTILTVLGTKRSEEDGEDEAAAKEA